MTQVDTSENTAEGNTNSLGVCDKKHRKWVLTLNNYIEEELTQLTTILISKKWLYIIGKEVGEQGTPHLQGYIEAKNPIRFQTLRKIAPRAHWEVAKGNRESNLRYCSKENNYETNMDISPLKTLKERLIEAEFAEIQWKTWQAEILLKITNKPSKREIIWVWDEEGNKGKSLLAKYICLKYDAIICSGKSGDIFNQLKIWRDNNPNELQLPICLIDNPRSEYGHINYSAIEQIKNGLVYSGKYEGGQIFGLSPHIVVFANSEPNFDEMSKDRWNIMDLNENPSGL